MILTDENFEKEIIKAEKPVLVDFWMENCGPCFLISPILEKLAKQFSEKLIFAKVNFNSALSVIQKYGLTAAPTIILFKNGQPINGFIGLKSENEIKQWLEENLK